MCSLGSWSSAKGSWIHSSLFRVFVFGKRWPGQARTVRSRETFPAGFNPEGQHKTGQGCPACPGCFRWWGGRGCPGCPGFSCLSGLVSGLSGCRWTGLSGLSRALAVCLGSSVRAVRRVFGGGVGPSGVGPSCPGVSSGRGLQSGQCGCFRSWACAGVYMGIGIC